MDILGWQDPLGNLQTGGGSSAGEARTVGNLEVEDESTPIATTY